MGYSLHDIPPNVRAQLHAWTEPDFTCAICQQVIDCRWNPRGASRQIPPLCCQCERVSGHDWTGRARYRTKPTGGTHMDRRNATRILALADELAALAARIQWSAQHGA